MYCGLVLSLGGPAFCLAESGSGEVGRRASEGRPERGGSPLGMAAAVVSATSAAAPPSSARVSERALKVQVIFALLCFAIGGIHI